MHFSKISLQWCSSMVVLCLSGNVCLGVDVISYCVHVCSCEEWRGEQQSREGCFLIIFSWATFSPALNPIILSWVINTISQSHLGWPCCVLYTSCVYCVCVCWLMQWFPSVHVSVRVSAATLWLVTTQIVLISPNAVWLSDICVMPSDCSHWLLVLGRWVLCWHCKMPLNNSDWKCMGKKEHLSNLSKGLHWKHENKALWQNENKVPFTVR